MAVDGVLNALVLDRRTGAQQLSEALQRRRVVLLDLLDALAAEPLHAPRGLLDHLGAVALLGLLLVRVVLETVEHLFRWHVFTSFQVSNRAGDGVGEPAEPLGLGHQLPVVLAQCSQLVGLAVQHAGDRVQAQAELPQHQDLLQAPQLL